MSQQTSQIDENVEQAAAMSPYPYPAPLPPHAKAAHMAAVAEWQRRIFRFALPTYLPAVALMASTRVLENMHVSHTLLWTVFLIGAAGVIASGIPLRRKVQAKKRHVKLLKAYGVELDRNGRER